MTEQGWMRLLRGAAFVGGIVAMYVSAQFSVEGFSINHPNLIWIGWFLAALIVVVEFTWRKPGMEDNLTMAIVGICAYTFGIITNVRGLMIAMGVVDWQQEIFSVIIAVITGIFLEIMPEPFFSWGLTGKSMADMFGEVQSMVNGDTRPIPHYDKQRFEQRQPQQQQWKERGDISPEARAALERFQNQRHQQNEQTHPEPQFVPVQMNMQPTPPKNHKDGGKQPRQQFQRKHR